LQQRKAGLELSPNPPGQIFTRRVGEAFHFVEEVVVELLPKWFEGLFDVREVLHPTSGLANRTFDVNLTLERVPVETVTLVVFGNVRKTVSRLESELFVDLHNALSDPKDLVCLNAEPPPWMR
jgi:hypothetical protein